MTLGLLLLLFCDHFGVGARQLEPNRLRTLRIEAYAVQLAFRLISILARGESDETNRSGGFPVLVGGLQLRVLVASIGTKQQIELAWLCIQRQSGDEQSANLNENSSTYEGEQKDRFLGCESNGTFHSSERLRDPLKHLGWRLIRRRHGGAVVQRLHRYRRVHHRRCRHHFPVTRIDGDIVVATIAIAILHCVFV